MYILVSVLILLVCVILVLIVLVQNSKGGGLVGGMGGQNQMMGGVRQTTDFLEKATWTLASALLVLSVVASITIPRATQTESSRIQEQIQNAVDPEALPNVPMNFENQTAPPPQNGEEE
ncbi:MAG: preprotein translocase subunit SecG [Bacteroidetes bacterium]|jgi:preprotein translocase subunit SecG|nr:preprotein translocase subunit SecG [Bacteroidota bacterium]